MAVIGLCTVIGAAPAFAAAPVDRTMRPQKGVASFYGRKEAGKPTASGAPMKPNAMTAASPNLPLGTKAQVVNVENGRSVAVTVNDRGPYVPGRIVDVTPKAADQLDIKAKGLAKVVVKPLREPN